MPASPLNPVKLELGVIVLGGLLLLLLQQRIVSELWLQVLLLLGYGFLGAAWVVVRTRRVLRRTLERPQ